MESDALLRTMVGHEPSAGISEWPADAAMKNAASWCLPSTDTERSSRTWLSEGGMVRTSAGWRRRMLWVGLLLGLAAHAAVLTASEAPMWEPGMYWTYDVTVAWGQTRSSQVTAVVATADAFLGVGDWAWVVVGVGDGFAVTELVTAQVIFGPPAVYVRWPVVVGFLQAFEPVSLMPSIASLASAMPMSLANQAVRIETVSPSPSPWPLDDPARLDWLDRDLAYWETPEIVTLIPRDPAELVLPAGVFPGSIPLEYERTRGDQHSGTAWWVPDLLCWGASEGTETILHAETAYQYRIELSEWGRWSEAEMTDRIRAALDSMELLRPDGANGMRAYLRAIGLDL